MRPVSVSTVLTIAGVFWDAAHTSTQTTTSAPFEMITGKASFFYYSREDFGRIGQKVR
ncbi:MAG: hypothetical protein QNL91_12825 [Candidatus Krumholzibacteria bacterium]|nr:hypothetical protein [Candidatus Krumholzibacteria bacterium]